VSAVDTGSAGEAAIDGANQGRIKPLCYGEGEEDGWGAERYEVDTRLSVPQAARCA
jgi:hypothetical protein